MTFAVGQGAAQALEDALAVADAIVAPGDLEAALRAYEQTRIARTAKFQTMAWKLARAGTLTHAPGPQIRNAFFALTSPIAWRMQVKDMVPPAP
jgi:2-polyprenyl-6-methoxyphenol hydroxylase-like FAD-dependent oxidoreductase